jgi:hypothetical protein
LGLNGSSLFDGQFAHVLVDLEYHAVHAAAEREWHQPHARSHD